MTDYERYQLEWMIEHGHSLRDFVESLSELSYDMPDAEVGALFTAWEADFGFDGEIYPCEEEYNKEDAVASAKEAFEVSTPIGSLVVTTQMSDPGTYDSVSIDLEKPDGTSGQVALVEVVSGSKSVGYPTRLHTFAFDGNDEEPRRIDCDPDGERMQDRGWRHGRQVSPPRYAEPAHPAVADLETTKGRVVSPTVGKDWREKMEDAIESADWTVRLQENNEWEVGRYSDAGEDFSFSVTADSPEEFAREVQDYFNSFDPEEHAAMWHGANRGEPSSLRALLDDADSIKDNLEDLAIRVTQAAGLMAAHEEQDGMAVADLEAERRDLQPSKIPTALERDIAGIEDVGR